VTKRLLLGACGVTLIFFSFWTLNLTIYNWWAAGGPPNPSPALYEARGNRFAVMSVLAALAGGACLWAALQSKRTSPRKVVALATSVALLACEGVQTFNGLSQVELEQRLAEQLPPGTTESDARRALEGLGFRELVLDSSRHSLFVQIDEERSSSFDSVLTTYVVSVILDDRQRVASFSGSLRRTGP
jgi:hypothetical protein